ncbi:MAG: hypothetical protein IKY26_01765 [Erysipelotrichaceae bacterium]|nr:hypothetical protein [Erysipelotrichaceae bacterium]
MLINKPYYKKEYCIKLVTTNEKDIPSLVLLGNMTNRKIVNQKDYVDYLLEFVSWNNSKYIHKIEEYFIEMYESWKNY